MEFRTIRPTPPGQAGPPSPVLEEGVELTPEEVRVLGSLVEKDAATPDYYPLTLNSLVSACNQKSSRYPAVSYTEEDVLEAIDGLKTKGLAHRITSSDSRTPRYRHVLHDALRLTQQQGAVLCVLLLRGPQTAGELRQRTNRIYPFDSLEEVDETLESLLDKKPRPLVAKLLRQPGEKEPRYLHLLSGPAPEAAEPVQRPAAEPSRAGRLEALEREVGELRSALETLRSEFDRFRQQFS